MAKQFAILVLLLFVQGAFGQAFDSFATDRLAQQTLSDFRLPGLAVAIVKDDRVVYLKGLGVREAGGKSPVTPDTLFQIASTTKAFTTTAMAMLVDEKKMSWDDPVRKHVDYFRLGDPCADSLVTLRDIVSHRTGLSRHDVLWDYTPLPREEIVRRVARVELSKPFRSAYQYNNIMFMTAGEAIESASGMPWEAFLKTRIFEPLGMRSTVIAEADWLRGERASAHRYDSAKQTIETRPAVDYESVAAAGAMKSTARDMAQWVRFQLNQGEIGGKRLLSADALRETKAPQTVLPVTESAREDSPESNILTYGLGWRIQDYRGELLVWHAGALNHYRTQVALLPGKNTGIVLMTNVNRGYSLFALRNTLIDQLIGRGSRDWNAYFLAREAKLDAEAEKSKREKEEKRHRDTKPSRELSAYAGTYEHPAYGTAVVSHDDGQLVLQWQRLKLPLTHYHFDTFTAVDEQEDLDEQILFSLGVEGDVKSMVFWGQEFLKTPRSSL